MVILRPARKKPTYFPASQQKEPSQESSPKNSPFAPPAAKMPRVVGADSVSFGTRSQSSACPLLLPSGFRIDSKRLRDCIPYETPAQFRDAF